MTMKTNDVTKMFFIRYYYFRMLCLQKQGLLNIVFYTSQLFQNMLCLQFISIPQKRIIQDQQRRLYNVLYTLSCAFQDMLCLQRNMIKNTRYKKYKINKDVLKTFVIRYKAFQKTSCVYK